MAKIHINNPKQVINGGAKKYYFKVKGLGGPKGDKGDTGATGPQGPQGPQGNAATVSVGSTTTLPVGQDATVQNVGTLYNAVLNFGIPQGPRGPQGATGATGAKGDKGDQGNPGPQGEKGTNATVYVGTTSTLAPGSQATVYNSGSDSNAVLNFGIPQGEKGDTGPMPTIAQTTGQAIDQVMSQKATTDALNTKQATISSSNKLSADLVEDTSTTNKFVTAEDKTTWNAKQNALTAGQGIDITGGVISTPAIAPEVVAELPTTGEEGKLYLTPKAHTSQTATGNPIEATVTEQAGQLESFQLDGDIFQQSYTGVNLFNKSLPLSNTYYTSTGATATYSKAQFINYEVVPSSDKITMSYSAVHNQQHGSGISAYVRIVQYNSSNSFISRLMSADNNFTFTLDSNTAKVIICVDSGEDAYFDDLQLQYGSTATSYEPYVGGQPSPNPSYPQQIQTVTGEQTVSINATNYPISLGSLELCKIGTYKDYIYKDGESWKVHKAIGKAVLDGTEDWSIDAGGQNPFLLAHITSKLIAPSTSDSGSSYSDHYINAAIRAANTNVGFVVLSNGSTQTNIRIRESTMPTVAEFKTRLASDNVLIYTTLATPTDTTITDQTLIAQLEAIRTAALQNGTNTITNTATAPNLAGDMEIGYFGFNPTNRYDKWLWLDLNNNYEQIGS